MLGAHAKKAPGRRPFVCRSRQAQVDGVRTAPAIFCCIAALSSQRFTRWASATRVKRPKESSSTMIIGLLSSQACITRLCPFYEEH